MHQSQPHTKKKNMVEVVRVEVSREDSRVKIKKKLKIKKKKGGGQRGFCLSDSKKEQLLL